MFAALVAKHGLVPKGYMPETQSSSNTARMNSILQYQLRQGTRAVRAAAAESVAAARAVKADILQVIYRVLCIHLGTPPETFDWQWTDKDKHFHRDGVLTRRSSRPSTWSSRSPTTSAWSTTRGPPAPSAARSPSSTSAT